MKEIEIITIPYNDRPLLPAPAPIAGLLPAGPHPVALLVSGPVSTKLVYPVRSYRSRKRLAHIAVTSAFQRGNLKRAAGDMLCQTERPRYLDFVPGGVEICKVCMERAERYRLPIPDTLELKRLPSSTRLRPEDGPVSYEERSKWFNYRYGFPFEGWLRKWHWLHHNTVCAHCRSTLSLQDSRERVFGQPSAYYRKCLNGHLIKDERDLSWKSIPETKPAESVVEAYTWLTAQADEIVPF